MVHKRGFIPYLYVMPALVVYGVFILLPLAQNIFYSFFTWQSLTRRTFAGLGNYAALAKDPVFYTAFAHNVLWAALTLVFPLIVGFFLAVWLSRYRGRIVFSTIYFLPATVPLVVSGIIWGWIYNPVFGVLNKILEVAGLAEFTRSWIGESATALYALNVLGAWTFFGFCTVIFLSAMQGLDLSLFDAAKIDGANDAQCIIHITIPSLSNTIVFLMIYSIIGAMKFFDIVYITTQGGPGYATEIMGTYIFKLAFREQKLGYSAGVAVILMAFVMILSIFMIRRSERS
jgi:raffinose/stachyose/melibiose transport system permease protein